MPAHPLLSTRTLMLFGQTWGINTSKKPTPEGTKHIGLKRVLCLAKCEAVKQSCARAATSKGKSPVPYGIGLFQSLRHRREYSLHSLPLPQLAPVPDINHSSGQPLQLKLPT